MSRQDLIEKRNQIWLVGGISVAVLLVLAFAAGYFLFRSKHARACWGGPPSGMPPPEGYHRKLWLLPDGATFRGNVTIEYDEPTVVAHPTQHDCPLPG